MPDITNRPRHLAAGAPERLLGLRLCLRRFLHPTAGQAAAARGSR